MASATTTVRVPARTYERLRELSRQTGKPMTRVLDEAIERYDADRFFRELDASYRTLREDTAAWKDELAEREILDRTLADGLETE